MDTLTDNLTASPTVDTALCGCGHARSSHQHFRAGTDCALCGAGGCITFHAVRPRRRWRAARRRTPLT